MNNQNSLTPSASDFSKMTALERWHFVKQQAVQRLQTKAYSSLAPTTPSSGFESSSNHHGKSYSDHAKVSTDLIKCSDNKK